MSRLAQFSEKSETIKKTIINCDYIPITMRVTTATIATIPVCSFLWILLLHAPEITQALAPSSGGRENRVPPKSTLPQTQARVLQDKDKQNLQEYTQQLLSAPENNSTSSEFATPNEIIPVLSAWLKTESVQGAETEEQIVLRLKHDDGKGISDKHYAIANDAWGKEGNVDKATDLFEKMEYLAADDSAVAPNRVSYNTL